MRIITLCLTVGAIIAGLLAIMWGAIIGILGIGPDGDVSLGTRIIGLLMFGEGFLYLIPNHALIKIRHVAWAYLIATSLPAVITILMLIPNILINSYEIILLFHWGCIITLLCFPPASLWISMRYNASSNKALQAIGAKARLQPER